MIVYNATGDASGTTSVTVFITETGEALSAAPGHPNWDRLIPALASGVQDPDEVRDLFDVAKAISKRFERLGEQVAIKGNQVLFDGDPVDDVLAETIIAYHSEGHEDLLPLVKFMEKIRSNPNPNSRESLFGWMRNKSFHILDNGNFLAYKGVAEGDETEFRSISSGKATVNGVEFNGHIPQNVGDLVEMPRSDVDDNRGTACSSGLHVGTYNYARDFGHVLTTVEVNPRDVVSVPLVCLEQKMRVCRYKVVDTATEAHGTLFVDIQVDAEPRVLSSEIGPEELCYDEDEGDEFDDDPFEDDPFEVDDDPLDPFEDDEDDFDPVEVTDHTFPVKDVDPIDAVEDSYMARLRHVEAMNRDEVRRLAKQTGVTRGLKTKGQLAVAIVDKEFGR